ncbi:MAG: S46 family peptidase [Bacteroidales bacterium]|nr:S46 family peptidase [Bacteroidales bacterium]
MKKVLLIIALCVGMANINFADEGMWIPLLLEKYNIQDMQKKGFKLSAEDIYSINQDCLMDAVVIFGRGCTGEIVSDKGLLLTNHHCGYGAIQKHSTIEHDYLTNGFWAMNMKEELPNPDLSVKFLKRIEDVSAKVLKDIKPEMTEANKSKIIVKNIAALKKQAQKGNNYKVVIKPFFYGNQYYMFLYEEYTDVRLVGAPPSAIGKFGGDTDNWMWPRHTGDFSIFRVYADKNNKPAKYSKDNVPYKPKKFLPISIKGIKKGDFTWVMGYPGSTQEYLISDAIKLIANVRNPHRIKLRDERLAVMNSYASKNDTIRIKYASKNARVSNSWKRWKGEISGLERLQTIKKKQELEQKFQAWAKQNNKTEYSDIIPQLSKIYSEVEDLAIAYDYWRESIRAIEVISFASKFDNIIRMANEKKSDKEIKAEIEYLQAQAKKFYKDYVRNIDEDIFSKLVPMYFENVKSEYQAHVPDLNLKKGISTYAHKLFNKTIFTNEEKCTNLLNNFTVADIETLKQDPVYVFYTYFKDAYTTKVKAQYDALNAQTNKLYRSYLKGLQEMNPDKIYYPDANFTMRVSYGNIEGFSPRDGVEYTYYTTIDGVIEKDNPEIYDYDVPDRLKELHTAKDFGRYQENGTVNTCFIATNHTTGGNSGSPVLDAEGNLIGLNFDRAWHGIQSDMMFDPERSRNVTLDIRYLLFIIDKLAGAGHLVEEMTIIE